MPCWVAIALLMESTNGWRHTGFIGRYPRTIQAPHRSTTSAKAVKRSIVDPRARSRWRFPCVASESNGCFADRGESWRLPFEPRGPVDVDAHRRIGAQNDEKPLAVLGNRVVQAPIPPF